MIPDPFYNRVPALLSLEETVTPIRRAALAYNIPYATTIAAARATCQAVAAINSGELPFRTMQEYHGESDQNADATVLPGASEQNGIPRIQELMRVR